MPAVWVADKESRGTFSMPQAVTVTAGVKSMRVLLFLTAAQRCGRREEAEGCQHRRT